MLFYIRFFNFCAWVLLDLFLADLKNDLISDKKKMQYDPNHEFCDLLHP